MSKSRNQKNKARKKARSEEDRRLAMSIRKGKRVNGNTEKFPAFHLAKSKSDINALERDPLNLVKRKGYKRAGKRTWRQVSTFETLRQKAE